VRCGQLVCATHIPSRNERCWNCEGTYHERRATRGEKLAFWIPFCLVWLVLLVAAPALLSMGFAGGGAMRSFSTGVPMIDATIIAAMASLGLGYAGRWTRNRILRRRFLAE
jgi:hypothetical protein